MSVRSYGDYPATYRGAPRPPADIEAAMMAAGKAGDDVALGLAHARYTAWIIDHGHETHRPQGRPPRADEAAR